MGKIRLEVIDQDSDHFILFFDRPARVEVTLLGTTGRILAHVYDGIEVDMDQRPLFAYDGTQDDNDPVTR